MYKRYGLDVFCGADCVYSASFSSINLLVKFACGFDFSCCELDAIDYVFNKSIPILDYCKEFRGDCNGI